MIDDAEIEESDESFGGSVIAVSAATFSRVASQGSHEIVVPFVDYSTAVPRKPDSRSADTVGFVPSLVAGMDVKLVTGVAKTRQEAHAHIAHVDKVLRGGPRFATRSRMSRLALRVTLEVSGG